MTTRKIVASAVQSTKFNAVRQPLSGYIIGHDRATVYRVQLKIGNTQFFESTRTYQTRALADAAADRLNEAFS